MFKLKLNNYRGFIDQEFDFSRVNILIGENSAGKSSIFKFLLALKQSLRSPNNKDYNLTLSSDEVDLGNYSEVIYNHEIERNLGFSFEFGKDYYDYFFKELFSSAALENELKSNISKYVVDAQNSSTILNFQVCNNLSNHNNINFSAINKNIGTIKFVFSDNEAGQDIYIFKHSPKCEIIFESKQHKQEFHFKNIAFEKHGFLSFINGDTLKDSIEKYNNLEEIDRLQLYEQIVYLLFAQSYLEVQLAKIEYINPLLHKKAERIYLLGDKKHTRQIKDIKDLVDFLDTSTTKEVFKTDLGNLLKTFGIADSFSLKKEGFVTEFRVTINKIESNIKDVGFGVSLQIPILAQAIISENTFAPKSDGSKLFAGETLLIEQPEVHLHPRLQAKFMEALLSIGKNNVYFVETHSEHIIRMLQVLVKTKKIESDEISIHYFKKEGMSMEKSVHKIEYDGVLMPNFPKGFYDVSYNLALNLMD